MRRLGEREVEIAIREGRNRQVRRMFEAVGNEIVGLRRVAFGRSRLGDLKTGAARSLEEGEVAALWKDGAE